MPIILKTKNNSFFELLYFYYAIKNKGRGMSRNRQTEPEDRFITLENEIQRQRDEMRKMYVNLGDFKFSDWHAIRALGLVNDDQQAIIVATLEKPNDKRDSSKLDEINTELDELLVSINSERETIEKFSRSINNSKKQVNNKVDQLKRQSMKPLSEALMEAVRQFNASPEFTSNKTKYKDYSDALHTIIYADISKWNRDQLQNKIDDLLRLLAKPGSKPHPFVEIFTQKLKEKFENNYMVVTEKVKININGKEEKVTLYKTLMNENAFRKEAEADLEESTQVLIEERERISQEMPAKMAKLEEIYKSFVKVTSVLTESAESALLITHDNILVEAGKQIAVYQKQLANILLAVDAAKDVVSSADLVEKKDLRSKLYDLDDIGKEIKQKQVQLDKLIKQPDNLSNQQVHARLKAIKKMPEIASEVVFSRLTERLDQIAIDTKLDEVFISLKAAFKSKLTFAGKLSEIDKIFETAENSGGSSQQKLVAVIKGIENRPHSKKTSTFFTATGNKIEVVKGNIFKLLDNSGAAKPDVPKIIERLATRDPKQLKDTLNDMSDSLKKLHTEVKKGFTI
jgi:hypothetical protein